MKIKKFITSNMYGYLNLKVDFNDDLTFLTGINGSGKTSIVRGIVSLLKPSLKDLFRINYDLIKVELEYNNKQIVIYSTKDSEKFRLGCTGYGLKPNKVEFDLNIFQNKNYIEDFEEEHFWEKYLNTQNPQLNNFFSNLPNPLTLGVERRVSEFLTENIQRKSSPLLLSKYRRYNRSPLETFFGYIPQLSLENAIKLAEEEHKKTQNALKKYTEELRNNLVTQSITIMKRNYNISEMKKKVKNININIVEIIDTITNLPGLEDAKIKRDLTNFYAKFKENKSS